jgi:hypothetical protein
MAAWRVLPGSVSRTAAFAPSAVLVMASYDALYSPVLIKAAIAVKLLPSGISFGRGLFFTVAAKVWPDGQLTETPAAGMVNLRAALVKTRLVMVV